MSKGPPPADKWDRAAVTTRFYGVCVSSVNTVLDDWAAVIRPRGDPDPGDTYGQVVTADAYRLDWSGGRLHSARAPVAPQDWIIDGAPPSGRLSETCA